MVRDIHDPLEELAFDHEGVVHRVTRLAGMYALTHCMDVRRPAMRYDETPVAEFATCFFCVTSRYRK